MNAELTHWTGPHGLPRFDLIADADVVPAVDAALEASATAWEAIATDPAAPDFTNTIAAMEGADRDLDRVLSVFYTLAGNASTPAREEIERALAPKLAAHRARIMTDPRLLARVEAVPDAGLDDVQARMLDLARRGFRRGGAGRGRPRAHGRDRRAHGRADDAVLAEPAEGRA